jgi:GTP-binding protein EngB required for normal cell division
MALTVESRTLPVEALRDMLVAAIDQLPDEIPAWGEADADGGQPLIWRAIHRAKASSLGRIDEAARLWRIFSGRKVIAMVGNVNAGKSSLGNLLLDKAAGEVFAEDDIRATAEASIADFGPNVLIDLPGLGSVLSEKDDAVVNEYVNRADLLLIVHYVGSDIDPVLYTFLKAVALAPQDRGQRIIIVFNKTDTRAPGSLEKTLSLYKEVLLDGAKGFAGIRQLFRYSIPLIPFSVFDARSGLLSAQALREAIDVGIEASGGDSSRKNWDELKSLREEWRFVPVMAAELGASAEHCLQEKNQQRDALLAELARQDMVRIQLSQVEKGLDQEATAALSSMARLPGPNAVEKARNFMAGAGPQFTAKRNAFISLCSSTVDSMESNYREHLGGYLVDMANFIRAYYPEATVPTFSDLDTSMLGSYQLLIKTKTAQYLDGHFDGQKVADTIHQRRVKEGIAAIRRHYQQLIRQYDEVVRQYVQAAYQHSLAEVESWRELQAILTPFCSRYQEMTDLIHRAEGGGPAPSTAPPPPPPPTADNHGVLAIVLVVIAILIIIIAVASRH